MIILRYAVELLTIVLATLTGNWLGGRVYALLVGGPGYRLGLTHTGPDGELIVALNPLMSNFLPGLLLGLAGRPRILSAFVGGFAAAALLGDRYEDRLWSWIRGAGED